MRKRCGERSIPEDEGRRESLLWLLVSVRCAMDKPLLAVGIDPAKRQHHAMGVLYPDELVLESTFANDVADIEHLDAQAAELAQRHQAELVYGVEDHRGLGRRAVEILQRRGREVRVVNPLTTNRQKEFYGEDKNDAVDARAIAAVVLRRRRHLPDATDRDELITAVRETERTLQDLSERRSSALSQLHEQLGAVYPPSYDRFFSKLKGPWALLFFRRFPLPQDLVDHDSESLADVLADLARGPTGKAGCRHSREKLRERATWILDATSGLGAMPRTRALALKAELIRQLCDEILALNDRIERLERMLSEDLLPQLDERVITTLPGVGVSLGAAIIGETGDILRFPSRDAFAKYNGTAPAEYSSGGRERHRSRRGCNRRLKRALWLAARAAVLHDDLAADYYHRCRARGISKIDSLKRVARRMSDIIYAMLRRGEPYNRDCLIPNKQGSADKPETGGTASNGPNQNSLTDPRHEQNRQQAPVDQAGEAERGPPQGSTAVSRSRPQGAADPNYAVAGSALLSESA
ncbi:IS110 family transposase [Halorhodospira sp. 9621]|uniref:IS110 family transposase n=1 Tax=Halorhodospira sp. 9621 TaxID=2899135 RepID=UPI003FCE4E8F